MKKLSKEDIEVMMENGVDLVPAKYLEDFVEKMKDALDHPTVTCTLVDRAVRQYEKDRSSK